MSSFCTLTHIFFSKNTCELDIVLTRTVNILITNEIIKLTMLWTTEPWYFSYFPQKIGSDISCKLSPIEKICMEFQSQFSEEKDPFSRVVFAAKQTGSHKSCLTCKIMLENLPEYIHLPRNFWLIKSCFSCFNAYIQHSRYNFQQMTYWNIFLTFHSKKGLDIWCKLSLNGEKMLFSRKMF